MIDQHQDEGMSCESDEAKQFEPFWTCRLCASADLLVKSHVHCPNCGHERDEETIIFPDWDDLVASADHRFTGTAWSCCDTGWSADATFCGVCARMGVKRARPAKQTRRAVQLRVVSSFGFHLNVAGIDVGAFDDDESDSNLVFLGSPLKEVRTLAAEQE